MGFHSLYFKWIFTIQEIHFLSDNDWLKWYEICSQSWERKFIFDTGTLMLIVIWWMYGYKTIFICVVCFASIFSIYILELIQSFTQCVCFPLNESYLSDFADNNALHCYTEQTHWMRQVHSHYVSFVYTLCTLCSRLSLFNSKLKYTIFMTHLKLEWFNKSRRNGLFF